MDIKTRSSFEFKFGSLPQHEKIYLLEKIYLMDYIIVLWEAFVF